MNASASEMPQLNAGHSEYVETEEDIQGYSK
jgi:hypothetical protein